MKTPTPEWLAQSVAGSALYTTAPSLQIARGAGPAGGEVRPTLIAEVGGASRFGAGVATAVAVTTASGPATGEAAGRAGSGGLVELTAEGLGIELGPPG